MASAFAHAFAAFTVGKTYSKNIARAKFFILGCTCAVIPDLDVVMFNFVEYGHFLGHRGFFHSFFFCFVMALFFTAVFYSGQKLWSKSGLTYLLYFFICGSSHALLDMLTSGGLGVAIFSPFNNERYFFPWRPIKVSPIGMARFFSEWGLRVIKSEIIWVGLPCCVYLCLLWLYRKLGKTPD